MPREYPANPWAKKEKPVELTPEQNQDLRIPRYARFLLRPKRYKVLHGGRGGAKSWTVSRALISLAHTKKKRIGCFRELQNSIKDSVHKLLSDQIAAMKLDRWFWITQTSIIHKITGSEFLFKGLRLNATEIKSTEGIDIAWIEEAQLVSETSWELLIPTIRKEDSEIWVTFNAIEETDATYQRFIVNPPPESECIVRKVNYDENPWFPQVLESERLYLLKKDPEAYEHVWGGNCRIISEAVIFRNRYVVDTFEAPYGQRLFFGMDFGFSGDPSCLTRSYVTGEPPIEELWIEYAEFGYHVEIDELPKLMDKVPASRKWPIKADSSRPETISYLRRQGFSMSAAEKWDGSVEDGIAHLKGFKTIHIHQRCKEMQQEARLYCYKVDKNTNDILPLIVDRHNHGWDSNRYGLDGYIKKRGANQIWGKL